MLPAYYFIDGYVIITDEPLGISLRKYTQPQQVFD